MGTISLLPTEMETRSLALKAEASAVVVVVVFIVVVVLSVWTSSSTCCDSSPSGCLLVPLENVLVNE